MGRIAAATDHSFRHVRGPAGLYLGVSRGLAALRGPRGDGTWQAPKLPDTWPADGLQTVWRQPIGGGYAGVSVADGRVLVMDRQQQPSEVERIVAFDAATGRTLWKHEYPVVYGNLDYGNGPCSAHDSCRSGLYARRGRTCHVPRLRQRKAPLDA